MNKVFWQSSPAGVSPGLLAVDLACGSPQHALPTTSFGCDGRGSQKAFNKFFCSRRLRASPQGSSPWTSLAGVLSTPYPRRPLGVMVVALRKLSTSFFVVVACGHLPRAPRRGPRLRESSARLTHDVLWV